MRYINVRFTYLLTYLAWLLAWLLDSSVFHEVQGADVVAMPFCCRGLIAAIVAIVALCCMAML